MKKIFELIKTKEAEEKTLASNKKPTAKDSKTFSAADSITDQQNDLYSDGYSDLGYC